jgi:hypothetical protein
MTANFWTPLSFFSSAKVSEISVLFAETAEFGLALLDVNVAGHSITSIAQILERRGLPFVFVSRYTATGLPEPFGTKPMLHKPFQITHSTFPKPASLSETARSSW